MARARCGNGDGQSDPAAVKARAVTRFAALEAPGLFVLVVGVLVCLHATDDGMSAEAVGRWAAIAVGALALYVATPVAFVLWPGLKGGVDAD